MDFLLQEDLVFFVTGIKVVTVGVMYDSLARQANESLYLAWFFCQA